MDVNGLSSCNTNDLYHNLPIIRVLGMEDMSHSHGRTTNGWGSTHGDQSVVLTIHQEFPATSCIRSLKDPQDKSAFQRHGPTKLDDFGSQIPLRKSALVSFLSPDLVVSAMIPWWFAISGDPGIPSGALVDHWVAHLPLVNDSHVWGVNGSFYRYVYPNYHPLHLEQP